MATLILTFEHKNIIYLLFLKKINADKISLVDSNQETIFLLVGTHQKNNSHLEKRKYTFPFAWNNKNTYCCDMSQISHMTFNNIQHHIINGKMMKVTKVTTSIHSFLTSFKAYTCYDKYKTVRHQ